MTNIPGLQALLAFEARQNDIARREAELAAKRALKPDGSRWHLTTKPHTANCRVGSLNTWDLPFKLTPPRYYTRHMKQERERAQNTNQLSWYRRSSSNHCYKALCETE